MASHRACIANGWLLHWSSRPSPNTFTRIDVVALSNDGERAFVQQKGLIPDVTDKLASVETKEAVATTLTQSTAAVAQVNQQQKTALAKAHAAPQIEPPQAAPVASGHSR